MVDMWEPLQMSIGDVSVGNLYRLPGSRLIVHGTELDGLSDLDSVLRGGDAWDWSMGDQTGGSMSLGSILSRGLQVPLLSLEALGALDLTDTSPPPTQHQQQHQVHLQQPTVACAW